MHTTLFRRLYNVHNVGATSYERTNDVVCVLGIYFTRIDFLFHSFYRNISGCEESAAAFALEEIDGRSLLLLKVEHMVQTMNLKLGPALKIASCLRDVKMEYGIQTRTKYLSSP